MTASAVHVPTELIDVWPLRDGRRITLRPVLPQDAGLQQALVRALSPAARYQRFFAPIRELPDAWLRRMTEVDHDAHVALIVEHFDGGLAEPVAEARYVVDADSRWAEFAVTVAERWRRQGIARRLIGVLREHAQGAGLVALHAEVLADNRPMLTLARGLGFQVRSVPGDARVLRVQATLSDGLPRPAAPGFTAAGLSAPAARATP